MKSRVNWKSYNQNLIDRGSLTLWISEEALEGWIAPMAHTQGAQIFYSELAMELMNMIRFRYRLPLRATQGFVGSIFNMMSLFLPVPHYSTMSRRLKKLSVEFRARLESREALHVVIDSTGLKVYGEGEWKVRQHGYNKRRTWRKLHLAVDAETNQILTAVLTTNDYKDNEIFGDLVDSVDGEIAQVSGDGAYDAKDCYVKAKERNFYPNIPPRIDAKIQKHGNSKGNKTDRDENLRAIRKLGRKGWKETVNYHQRSLAETAMYRYKTTFGERMNSREFGRQSNEAFIKCQMLNRMGTPKKF